MRKSLLLTAAAGLALLAGPAAAQTRTTLDVYVVDVEGGNATLFVTPSGESLLIDTGNYGPEASVRDAGRIMRLLHLGYLHDTNGDQIRNGHRDRGSRS